MQRHHLFEQHAVAVAEVGAEMHAGGQLAVREVGGEPVVLLLRTLAVDALEDVADRLLVPHEVGLKLADEGIVAVNLMAAGRQDHELAAQRGHLHQ